MMQCAQCDHWVHAKCEGLSGEQAECLGCHLCPRGEGGRGVPCIPPAQALMGQVS